MSKSVFTMPEVRERKRGVIRPRGDVRKSPGRIIGRLLYVLPKPERNKPCTCNSGIKYKKCCGKAVPDQPVG